MKILTVVGARPQFIKATLISRSLKEAGIDEFIVHTGQHYDLNMSEIFFRELELPTPDVNLNIGSGSLAFQIGNTLVALEKVAVKEKPDIVMVYGDTNSTLAGAIAACSANIPLAHVEAGLRSFNRTMPEEHNRVLTDHCSDLLFCPTKTAVKQLYAENIQKGVHLVGDPMYDAVLHFGSLAQNRSDILSRLNLDPKQFLLATIHRAYNTDQQHNLKSIFEVLSSIKYRIVLPIHPRTKKMLNHFGLDTRGNIECIPAVGYLDMLMLEQNAKLILTDSGGVQKEAFFFNVPCITLRSETEWVETVQTGRAIVVGTDKKSIINAINKKDWPIEPPPHLFGDGHASFKIAKILKEFYDTYIKKGSQ